MKQLKLEVKKREADNPKEVRREGLIPATFYGPAVKNQNFTIDYQTFRRAYEKAGGNTVIELDIEGKSKAYVLVHDVQYDPVTDRFIHVDFLHVDMDKEVTAEVPLILTGESKAVRDEGGILMGNRDAIEVRCLAKNLPHEIKIDISSLETFHDSIHIGDIALPKGVEAVDDPDLTVATVSAPREEEEEVVEEDELLEGMEGIAAVEGAEDSDDTEGEASGEDGKSENSGE